MFSWLAKRLLDRAYGRLNAGDPGMLLKLDAKDVHFRFPGESSWAADIRGRDEVERWLQRMIATGLQHRPEQVVVQGPPWNMTVCLRGTDHLRTPEGTTAYSNRYVVWGRMSCGACCATTRSTRTRRDSRASMNIWRRRRARSRSRRSEAADPRSRPDRCAGTGPAGGR